MRDTGPPLDEEETRHRRGRKAGRKKFCIERRWVGPEKKPIFMWFYYSREWHVNRRYLTAKQRDQALVNLNHKVHNSHPGFNHFEYRAVEVSP